MMNDLDLTKLPPEYALSKEELEKLKYEMRRSYYLYSTSDIGHAGIGNKLLENINEAYEESSLR